MDTWLHSLLLEPGLPRFSRAFIADSTRECFFSRSNKFFGIFFFVVLDEGKIVETGTHEELIRKKSLYHHLFTSGQQSL